LYVITLYVEALGNAIRAAHGVLSYVELDSICALFGLECDVTQAAQQALQAAGAIEGAIFDLNDRLGRQWDCKMKIAVSVHASRAAVGEIGSSDPPAMMAIGEAIDVANELRKAAVAHGVPFAISEPVYTAAGLVANCEKKITVPSPGREMPIAVCLSASAAALVPAALIASRSPMPKFLRKLRA
jgi:adenylate cyclase